MRGLMMDFPLTVPALLERAGHIFRQGRNRHAPAGPLARAVPPGAISTGARGVWRTRLPAWACSAEDRVATLLWNQSEHMEAYLASRSPEACSTR